jgi:hypothetical protein
VGSVDGSSDGKPVGSTDGCRLGSAEGCLDGDTDAAEVGDNVVPGTLTPCLHIVKVPARSRRGVILTELTASNGGPVTKRISTIPTGKKRVTVTHSVARSKTGAARPSVQQPAKVNAPVIVREGLS